MYMERVKTPEELPPPPTPLLSGTVVCQGRGEPRTVSMQGCTRSLRAREIALGGTNGGRGGSQTGQPTADSGGELRRRKSPSPQSASFQQ